MRNVVLSMKIFVITSFLFARQSSNPKTRNSKHKDTVAHTVSLVRVLFEDFGVAISIHGKAKDIHNTHPIPPSILLNDRFKFERGIVTEKEYN